MLLGLIGMLVAPALAGPDTTRDALERLEEVLELRLEDGRLSADEIMPALLVSALPRYEDSQDWFTVRAIEVVQTAFGEGQLRFCEACMAPRAFVDDGRVTYQTGPIGIPEVVRLDDQARGSSQPAKSAIWIDEHRGGVAIRIVDLSTSKVIFAQNIDPTLVENKNTKRMATLSSELERRARGDSLTQAFVDVAVYPGQHISFDWSDQWGKRNFNLSGVTLSLFDPVVGVGAHYARRFPILNTLVGAKVILSVPTALSRALSQNSDFTLFDPTLTGVGFARVPIGRSNYGIFVSASTNGSFGLGISLMNINLLPFLP